MHVCCCVHQMTYTRAHHTSVAAGALHAGVCALDKAISHQIWPCLMRKRWHGAWLACICVAPHTLANLHAETFLWRPNAWYQCDARFGTTHLASRETSLQVSLQVHALRLSGQGEHRSACACMFLCTLCHLSSCMPELCGNCCFVCS